MAEKGLADVLLLARLHVGLMAVDAVVLGSPEVAQDFGFDAFGLFLWQGVEQVLDAPCQANLARGLEVGAGTGISRDGLRIDGDDESAVACVLPGGQLAQAVIGFGTLRVKAAGIVGWRCQGLCGIFHCLDIYAGLCCCKVTVISKKSRTFAPHLDKH